MFDSEIKKKQHAALQSIPSPPRLTEWLSDHLGPLPVSDGNKYVLAFIDRAEPLWVELFAFPSTDALTVAKTFYTEICCRYGRVRSLCADKSKLVGALCDLTRVKKT
jgi:hypothetical protein